MPENLKGVHIHFVGIKGTGMAALVEIMHHCGAVISGSDVSERFYTDEILENLGIKAKNFDENNINDDIDFVIYSSAYKTDKNPDLIAAIRKNIPCILYTQALGQYSSLFYSCGVCGVHGKTSTTGLVGTILKELDLPVQVLVGSRIKSFGDSCTFTSDLFTDFHNQKSSEKKSVFVAETCEYQRHFMQFEPKNIILTSVESDHEDYYPTFKDIQNAFVDYLVDLKYENLKQTERVFRNDSCGDCYIVSWLELNTCNACIAIKNKQSVKAIQKDIRKRRLEKIKSVFSGKNKADEFNEDR